MHHVYHIHTCYLQCTVYKIIMSAQCTFTALWVYIMYVGVLYVGGRWRIEEKVEHSKIRIKIRTPRCIVYIMFSRRWQDIFFSITFYYEKSVMVVEFWYCDIVRHNPFVIIIIVIIVTPENNSPVKINKESKYLKWFKMGS